MQKLLLTIDQRPRAILSVGFAWSGDCEFKRGSVENIQREENSRRGSAIVERVKKTDDPAHWNLNVTWFADLSQFCAYRTEQSIAWRGSQADGFATRSGNSLPDTSECVKRRLDPGARTYQNRQLHSWESNCASFRNEQNDLKKRRFSANSTE